jgi:transposase
MQRVARRLRGHRQLLLNWFRAQGTVSAGVVEGLNYNAKLARRNAYGFRTFRGVRIALFHRLGHLPEPKFTHEFC